MLFNSHAFLFAFLPATLALYFALGRARPKYAALALAAASFCFYGWWNPAYVWLLLASTVFNYAAGIAIVHAPARWKKPVLSASIAADLLVLAYYKYWNFTLNSAAALLGSEWHGEPIILPIGISFFTFTQIAFLVDAYRGAAKEYSPVHYALFVSFFPHLLAGPLLHHKEMMPQFADPLSYRPRAENFSVGLTIFIIGLFKKSVLADGIATYAAPVFAAAGQGAEPDLVAAWGGALAYTFQLYFDFSGYSDMAIGAARMFGIVMPVNFFSPYKAASVTEFWRRWHMTLSRFLRDYLYIALGGNRRGAARRYLNLMLTMVLGGLWHGAAWTFVAWGALHGFYLVVHHAWRAAAAALGLAGRGGTPGRWAGRLVTFVAVVFGWVLFRAETFPGAVRIMRGMVGLNGAADTAALVGPWSGGLYAGLDQTLSLAALCLVAFALPNTQQFMARFRPALAPLGFDGPARWAWGAQPGWSLAMVAALLVALSRMSGVSEFLYYQF
jgi:D-alanyl-lipoteichoic acid acyltransferase DltB (MBOAT superfamily)